MLRPPSSDENPVRREKRKELVALYHNGGMPDTRIAAVLGVHRNTVKADRLELKIPRFSTICDVELANKIYQISQDIHAKVGKDTIDGQLLRQGHFVQIHRVKNAQRHLGLIQSTVNKKIKRMKWYEGVRGNLTALLCI